MFIVSDKDFVLLYVIGRKQETAKPNDLPYPVKQIYRQKHHTIQMPLHTSQIKLTDQRPNLVSQLHIGLFHIPMHNTLCLPPKALFSISLGTKSN